MDCHVGQTSSARRSLKRKLEQGPQDQARACKVLAVENPNKDVQSNSTTTNTPFSRPYWDHEVFLSFRGEDTRRNFADHLYNALVRVGIHTFRDDEGIRRGRTIMPELLNAIRRSRISIVVFSKDYASSRWCLDELVEIVRCKNTRGHTLFPIFYHVDPSDVQKQTGSFAQAFARHEQRFQTEMERVQMWRAALAEAANCSGWDLKSLANGHESGFVDRIVMEVSYLVKPNELKVAKHPIGIRHRVDRVVDLLNLGTNDVRMVGIYGLGGIGKTTLAKAVYNQICYGFEGSSCLLNIKQNSEQLDGLVRLQEQLLSNILKIKNLKIDNIDQGISLIEKRIYGKRVLIVLDDVDDSKQLYELLGSSKMFGLGSRVITTTRDEIVLTNLGVCDKYEVVGLEEEESLQLFNLNAFSTGYPKEDYMELSIGAVKYCKGLPLALEVLGSSLIGQSVAYWKMALEKLQKSPHPKIQEILQISFNSLDDATKNIFLDIACFFVGKDKEDVIEILDGCDYFLDSGINTLIRRSLLTMDKRLKMHDLIREMGREIVREQSPNYLGQRSRLWFHEDVLNVLNNQTGTKTMEGIISNLSMFENVHLETKAFTNMKKLRLLQLNGIHLIGSYEHLSKELRFLCWHKCPLKFLPQDFHLENLVVLDIQHSNIKEVWKNKKKFSQLKVLKLKDCKCLTKLPDFSQVPKVEILILEDCISLVQDSSFNFRTPPSVGVLDASGCTSMERILILPEHRSSQFFNLRNCPKLTEIQGFDTLEFTSTIHAEGCNNLVYDFKSLLQCSSTMGDDQCRVICLPGSEVPNWFNYQSIGASISFHVPSISEDKNLRLLVCAVYAANEGYKKMSGLDPHIILYNKARGCEHTLWPTLFPGPVNTEDHVLLYQTPLIRNEFKMESGEEIDVSLKLWKALRVKKCGIHLQFVEPKRNEEDETMVQSINFDIPNDDVDHEGKVAEDGD